MSLPVIGPMRGRNIKLVARLLNLGHRITHTPTNMIKILLFEMLVRARPRPFNNQNSCKGKQQQNRNKSNHRLDMGTVRLCFKMSWGATL